MRVVANVLKDSLTQKLKIVATTTQLTTRKPPQSWSLQERGR